MRGENVHPLHRRGEPIKESPLRLQTNDPVPPCSQHQRRHLDRTRICEQALRGVVEIEQHIDCYLAKDQWISLIARRLHRIVGQHFRPDVTLHLARPEKLLL